MRINISRNRLLALLSLIIVVSVFFSYAGVMGRKIALWGLSKGFPGAAVSFKQSEINPFGYINLRGLDIRRDGEYSFQAEELSIEYSLFSLAQGQLNRVYLDKPVLSLQKITALNKKVSRSPGKTERPAIFLPRMLEISGAELYFKNNGEQISLKASLQAGFNKKLSFLFLQATSFSGYGINAEGITVSLPEGESKGSLQAAALAYKKTKLNNLKAEFYTAEAGRLVIKLAEFKAWKGHLTADAVFVYSDQGLNCVLKADLKGADLEIISDELGFQEKVSISGFAAGDALLEADVNGLLRIEGEFATSEVGGVLSIRDKKILDYLAARTGSPLQSVYDSLKDYRYGKGNASISTSGNEMRFNIAFEGVQGRRVFDVRLHGFRNK